MRISPEQVQSLSADQKIVSIDDASQIVHSLTDQGAPVHLAQGVFDIVHVGHVGYLRAARAITPQNGIVVIGIENDEAVRVNKGNNRPINSAEDRATLLSEMESAHLVFVYPDIQRYDQTEGYISRYQKLKPTSIVAPVWDPHLDLKNEQARLAGTAISTVVYRHANSTTRMLHELGYE